MSSQSRRYKKMLVSFLTTIFKVLDEDDWGGLKRVVKQLELTKHIKLMLRFDSMSVVNFWIYVS